MDLAVLDRLADKILVGDDCWEWTAAKTNGGYGSLGATGLAHRVLYELLVGPIPQGFDIDHLCRNRGCVRPDHLEPATRSENLRRGDLHPPAAALQAAKTHCPRGHPYDEINTYWNTNGGRGHSRVCRACWKARRRERRTNRR